MHIHPPKPLHGWKEFLNEIFVIVIGVLIALGFEQVVEELHWQHKVHEGEERLRAEARRNFQRAAENVAVAPCIDAQIEALMNRVRSSGQRLDPAPETEMRRMPGIRRVLILPNRFSADQVWQALQLDGTTSHFAKARQLDLSGLYKNILNLDQGARDTLLMRNRLDVMAEPLELTPELRASLLQQLHELRATVGATNLLARQSIVIIQSVGLAPDPKDITPFLDSSATFGTIGYCKSKGLPLADWRKEAANEAPFLNATAGKKD